MKGIIFIVLAVCIATSSSCNKTNQNEKLLDYFKGLKINEIAAHDDKGEESWVEIVNTGATEIMLEGLGLYLSDSHFDRKKIYSFSTEKLSPGSRIVLSTGDEALVTGISSSESFSLLLSGGSGIIVDQFNSDKENIGNRALPVAGSYQRLPDGIGGWQFTLAASRNIENRSLNLYNTKPNAVWLWSTHMGRWFDNDNAIMKEIKDLGYDHVLLNFSAFDIESNRKQAVAFLKAAADLGIVVHVWAQCFYNNGKWINPVDDANNCYKEDVFDAIISKVEGYIKEYGVQGVHLDYIRFPGTAYKHNPSPEVTGSGAVTKLCRQIKGMVDRESPGTILSAALMSEDNGEYYYGQNFDNMSVYLDILMPMTYRYQEGGVKYGDAWITKMTKMFKTNAGRKPVWSGMQTYSYIGSTVTGNDAATILEDAMAYKAASSDGVVLFRYALGQFPDLSDFWK